MTRASQTVAKGVVTIVCRIEIRKNGEMLISQPISSCLTNHTRGSAVTTGSPLVIGVEDTEDLKPKHSRR